MANQEAAQNYGFCVPIPKFSGRKENFSSYAERFESSMAANNVVDQKRKIHIFMSSMGDELYKLAHDLFSPEKVSDQKFENVVSQLSLHLHPPPNIITARCNFNRTVRPDESISTFVVNLRRISEDCDCSHNLLMWFRNRFIAGVHNEAIRRRLLQEKSTMTFDQAYQIALSMETVNKETKAIQNQGTSTSSVHKLSQHKGKQQQKKTPKSKPSNYKPCIRYNLEDHKPPDCHYISATCNSCKEVGRLSCACCAPRSGKKKEYSKNKKSTNMIEVEESEVTLEDDDVFEEIFVVSSVHEGKTGKWKKTILVNDKPMKFELDSGSGVTLIKKEVYRSTFPEIPLSRTACQLNAYLGTDIPVLGKLKVKAHIE
ncbi:uncharacterized protein [Haliotis asinina]|uniref:uncharacterized protein n=1 Tax=Haliotis asinina TaxID=109174 RepID=UPI003531EBE0